MAKIKVGIVGCGTIGSAIARHCKDKLSEKIEITALYDLKKEQAEALKARLSVDLLIVESLEKLVSSSDLVIEAASGTAACQALAETIKKKRSIMIMSTGGILGRQDLLEKARESNCNVYIPSGAIFGLDGIKAAAVAGIEEAVLTTRKPPKGLKGAPYIEENAIDLDSIKEDRIVFEGTAAEAVKAFPKNVNVSASLSMAGIAPAKTRVRIICSPSGNRNIHEIELSGSFGKFLIKAENVPSPDNPKTSYLAPLSAMAALNGIVDNIRIGT